MIVCVVNTLVQSLAVNASLVALGCSGTVGLGGVLQVAGLARGQASRQHQCVRDVARLTKSQVHAPCGYAHW